MPAGGTDESDEVDVVDGVLLVAPGAVALVALVTVPAAVLVVVVLLPPAGLDVVAGLLLDTPDAVVLPATGCVRAAAAGVVVPGAVFWDGVVVVGEEVVSASAQACPLPSPTPATSARRAILPRIPTRRIPACAFLALEGGYSVNLCLAPPPAISVPPPAAPIGRRPSWLVHPRLVSQVPSIGRRRRRGHACAV